MSFSAISQFIQSVGSWPTNFVRATRKIVHVIHIIAVETLATLRFILPAALKWWYKRNFSQKLFPYSVELTKDKVTTKARLYLHGPLVVEKEKKHNPILLVHGDYSHPYTMLHLAKIAKKESCGPVFSLYIPTIHQEDHFNDQAALIEEAIDKIENLIIEQNGVFDGIFGVGHSKGAMLLVERQFSTTPSKIAKTFLIACPLKASGHEPSLQEPLKSIIEQSYERIKTAHDRKFVQIVPKNDWCSSYDAMVARPDEYCYVVPGMHLSGLYSRKTSKLFTKFITSSLEKKTVDGVWK